MFTVVQLLILIAAVIGSAGAAGVVAWLLFRTHKLAGHQDAALDGRMVDLQNEIDAMRGELTRLQEQADFTERLLSAGSTRDQPTGYREGSAAVTTDAPVSEPGSRRSP